MDRAASYYDGSTPRRRSAVVRADDDALTILDAEDGPPRTRRPAADVRLLAETGSRTDVRLRCGRGDDRLVVDGGTVPRWLADACPNLQHADLETAFAYLSSHPTTGERVAAIRARATGGRAAFSDREWAAVRRMCDGS